MDMKLNRFTPTCDWYRHAILEHDNKGNYIKVSDLLYWLNTHMREGELSCVYTDLLKSLGEYK